MAKLAINYRFFLRREFPAPLAVAWLLSIDLACLVLAQGRYEKLEALVRETQHPVER